MSFKTVEKNVVESVKTAEDAVESLWKNAATEVKYGVIAVAATLAIIAVGAFIFRKR